MNNLSPVDYLAETVRLFNSINRANFHGAERLKKIRDERLWEHGFASFDLFLEEELKMDESTASRLIGIYETFQLVPHAKLIQAGGWSNLAEIAPLVRKGILPPARYAYGEDAAEAWVDAAIDHNRQNLRAMRDEARTGILTDECAHEFITIQYCTKCKERHRVYEETKENLLITV